jgi:hypothetical protein
MSAFSNLKSRFKPDRHTPWVVLYYVTDVATIAAIAAAWAHAPLLGAGATFFYFKVLPDIPKREDLVRTYEAGLRNMARYIRPTKLERGIFISGTAAGAILPVALKLSGCDELTRYDFNGPSLLTIPYSWDNAAEMSYLGLILGGGVAGALYYGAKDITSTVRKLPGRVRGRRPRNTPKPS